MKMVRKSLLGNRAHVPSKCRKGGAAAAKESSGDFRWNEFRF